MAYQKPSSIRVLAPAGGFSSPLAISRALRTLAQSSDRGWESVFADILSHRYANTHVLLEGSGKDALRRCFAEISDTKDGGALRVGMGAYTCPDVAVAAVQAGCRIVSLDVDIETLDLSSEADTSACDVLLFSNLYGLADDIRRWTGKGLTLLDDACQAALSFDGDALVGARGADYGVLSFSRGKAICALGGGALLRPRTKDAGTAAPGSHETKEGIAGDTKGMALALASWAFEMPYLYGIPARIPALGLGKTHCSLEHMPKKLSRMQAAAALAQLSAAETRASELHASAEAWSEVLSELPLGQPYRKRANSGNCPIRYPLILPDEQRRDEALRALVAAGLGASPSYPSVLSDYPALVAHVDGPPAEGAIDISKRILTLPTHVYVGEGDREKAASILRKCI